MDLDNKYAFEIDFLPVGDGERSGDAIAMRWQMEDGFYVAVVDGGTKDSGEALVQHVRTHYGAKWINLVINTHPDQDHASGLHVVLESIPVQQLWMHRPWAHPEKIKHLFANSRFTTVGLAGRIKAALDCAYDLERIAIQKHIPIYEPFQGASFGPLVVLSPPQDFYLSLIPHFNNTPDAKHAPPKPLASIFQAAIESVTGIAESWDIETLREDGETSPQNESSVVLYGRFSGYGVLLTADAGQMALSHAILYAIKQGIDLQSCWLYQVPHHGSRRNISPTILDALLGPRSYAPRDFARYAIASVSAGSTTHPRRAVTNAFRRRGVGVSPTKGFPKYFRYNYPERPGYVPIDFLPLYETVEPYD